jgi:predicted alpha/beta-hydrolase family hydrolase
VTALAYEPQELREAVPASLILAHGAGANQRSPFIVSFARALAARGLAVVTFNFLYTEQRRRIPDRLPALQDCYRAVIAAVNARAAAPAALFIGGKSMGGRVATHIAAADPNLVLAGLVLLGYPLHPPGRPAERRDAHLRDVGRPTLFVQGSRDAFGTPEELESALRTMSPAPSLHVVDGGDHSFKVSRGGRSSQDEVDRDVQNAIVAWTLNVRADGRR